MYSCRIQSDKYKMIYTRKLPSHETVTEIECIDNITVNEYIIE